MSVKLIMNDGIGRYHHESCDWCKNPFESKRADKKYCSLYCNNQALYAKKKGLEPTAPQFRKGGTIKIVEPKPIKIVEPKPVETPKPKPIIQKDTVSQNPVIPEEKKPNKPKTFQNFAKDIIDFQLGSGIGLDDRWGSIGKLRSQWRDEVLNHCFKLITRNTKDYSLSNLDKMKIIKLYKGKIGSEKDKEELKEFSK